MLSLCGLFSDDFLKCLYLYLKQLCKIIMLCFQKIVSENSVNIPIRQNLIREGSDLPRPRTVAGVSHRWCRHLPGCRPGSLLCNAFYSVFQGSTLSFPPTLAGHVSIVTSLSQFLERGVSSPVSSARLGSQPPSVLPRKTWLCQLFHQPPASPVLHLFWPFSLRLTRPFVREECRTLGYSACLACGHSCPAHTHPPESPLVWLRVWPPSQGVTTWSCV